MRHIIRRFDDQPAWAVVTEIFIALGWLRAATAKAIDGAWWDGSELDHFLVANQASTLRWYEPFVRLVVGPNPAMFAVIVLVLEVVAAGCLLAGWRRSMGLAVGIVLNLHFLAAGAVNPSAFYLVAQGALALWLFEQRSGSLVVEEVRVVIGLSMAIVGLNLPFIKTLDPATVIEDPAVMMVMLGGLTCLGCLLVADRAMPLREQAPTQRIASPR